MRLIASLILIAALAGCHGAGRCGDRPWQQPCPIIDPYDPDPQP